MGACGSKGADPEAARRDAEIQKQSKREAEEEAAKIKLLLLGAGESGKSTIFKQMKLLYGKGFTDEDRKLQVGVMHSNMLTNAKALIQGCEELEIEIGEADIAEAVKDLSEEAPLDDALAQQLVRLWADAGIQEAYRQRAKFQLNDSTEYFFGRVLDMAKPDYVPSLKDVLNVRVRTSGIVEEEYTIDGVKFAMFDVGGQRNERKKWIHCFDDVTAVIFVAAISEYDQVLYEDASQNRMMESLSLFHEICTSKWFENTSIILFLNKRDLFEEKIKLVDIRHPNPSDPEEMLFDDYDGGKDYEAGVAYIVNRYLAQTGDSGGDGKEVYWHVTCATDSGNVSTVFNAAKDTILKANLSGSGFLD